MNEDQKASLPFEHAALLGEARPGIERLVAKMADATDVVFLVAEVDSALGKAILGLGVPRHPNRKTVVMPVTRDDALRAAGPLMSGDLSVRLAAHAGPAILVMAGGDGRLVGLKPA